MRKRERKENRLYKRNRKSIFLNGVKINENIFIRNQDNKMEHLLDLPIKDVFKEIVNECKETDNWFYDYYTINNVIKDNITLLDTINDWWRIGFKKQNKLKYLTIRTPHIYKIDDIDKKMFIFEIKTIMSKHYHKIFGYGEEYNIDYKFYKIKNKYHKHESLYEMLPNRKYGETKDTSTLLTEWIENNFDSEIVNFYKNLMIEHNNRILSFKEPFLIKSQFEKSSFEIVVPFFYEKSYKELFNDFYNLKFTNKFKYDEDDILIYLENNQKWKDFYLQFKPIKQFKLED